MHKFYEALKYLSSNVVLFDDVSGTSLNEQSSFQIEGFRQQNDSTLSSQDMPIETLRHEQQNNSRYELDDNSAIFLGN